MISKLPINIKIAEKYDIDKYLNGAYLISSPSQNYAIIQYLNEKGIALVNDGKLNTIFGKWPAVLKKKYNIDIKDLINKYPLDTKEIEKMKGEKRK